jgi:cytochrome c-type biogenesis protein CcmH
MKSHGYLSFLGIIALMLAAFTPLTDSALEARAIALEKTLRCPVCQGEPLSESQSPIAGAMRAFIRQSLSHGMSEKEIQTILEKNYGTDVSTAPAFKKETAVLWAGPFLILLPGAWWLRRFFRKRG